MPWFTVDLYEEAAVLIYTPPNTKIQIIWNTLFQLFSQFEWFEMGDQWPTSILTAYVHTLKTNRSKVWNSIQIVFCLFSDYDLIKLDSFGQMHYKNLNHIFCLNHFILTVEEDYRSNAVILVWSFSWATFPNVSLKWMSVHLHLL